MLRYCMFYHHFIICFFLYYFFLLFHNLFYKIVLLVKHVDHFDRKKIHIVDPAKEDKTNKL